MNSTADGAPLPWADGVYSVKRHGVAITNCDLEPVQTPGCIQGHGALVVLRAGDLTILQVSENSAGLLGLTPEELLQGNVDRILANEPVQKLRDALATRELENSPRYICTIPAPSSAGALDVSAHTSDGLVVVEFEAGGGEDRAVRPDYYGSVQKAVARLQSSASLGEFCEAAAREVRALSGLDRVMIYRFHEDLHGEVYAESKRDDLPGWIGLHYPAEDIPLPAREIFKKVGIRPVPDAAEPVAELVPLVNPDTGKPLTMTYCALRGASVMYTEYLRNMGVAASLTMPILVEGQLWGLIACHHYTPTRLPIHVRAACELMGQVTSLYLRGAEERENLARRLIIEEAHNRLIAAAAVDANLARLTEASSPGLLDGMRAAGAAVYHRERWWVVGNTPPAAHLDAIREWLAGRAEFASALRPVYATHSLAREFPPAAEFAPVGSGLLATALSRHDRSMILWFRPETIQEVRWGGNPHDKPTVPGPHGPRLTPRRSFELFVESVRRQSTPWNTAEVEAALRLRMLVMELVVSRAEKLAELNAGLISSNQELDAFAYVASHDLKEPLRGISKYAHQVMGSLNSALEENRKRLEGIVRLTRRMDSLLDSLLYFSRVGRTALDLQPVNVNEVVEEALEIIAGRRQEVATEIQVAQPLPQAWGDRMRIREIFVNLLTNALKYNDKPRRHVQVGWHAAGDSADPARVANSREEAAIFFVRDNGIGIDARHFETIFRIFKRLHGRDEYGGGSGAGLAIVQKLVEQHNGRIWLDSKVGEGSTFYFTLSPAKPATA